MDDRNPSAAAELPIRELEARITELAGHLNAASHRWLRLIAEFDRRQGWCDGCTRSCAHWLSWKCGLDLGAAREKVRVARALEALPLIDVAMSRGELSYSKVRALTRVATAATEDVLLNVALHGTTHHVETLVRQFRRVQEVEEQSREARQHAQRRLTYFHDADGSLVVRVQLPAESGALLLEALEAGLADVPLPNDFEGAIHVSAETRVDSFAGAPPPMSARRADALLVLAESFLQHGAEAMSGGDRHQIVLHVDVGRKTRSIPQALHRALKSRDQGCVFPGCSHRRYVDGHHIHHWADGGETKLANLVSLCRFHHRAVHEGGLRIHRLDDGAWQFINPQGATLDSGAPGRTRPFGDWSRLVAANREQGITLDATTAATRWRGERMDYGIAIDSLLLRSRRAAGSPTPGSGAGP